MFNDKEIVLEYVKREGPVLPIQVAKKTNSNTMFAGAILSELISNKLIRISYAKIGGSPVYYVEGQEEKLSILYDHLPGKEKEAYTLLKNNGILLDEVQEPSIRFALSQIKDFAATFFVNIKDKNIKCWRWHLIKEEDAVNLVKGLFKEEKREITERSDAYENEPEIITEQEQKEPKIERQPKKVEDNLFFNKTNDYLEKNKVSILGSETIKKGKEIDFIVNISSSMGNLNYFIKALNKKSISEKDAIYAYSKGNMKRLPAILLSNGKLSKKAEKYITQNLSGYLMFRKLE